MLNKYWLIGGAFALGGALVTASVVLPLQGELRSERVEHRGTREALADTQQLLGAEREARQGAANRIIAEQQRQARLVRERDQALEEAQAARGRIVTRTVEVIREIEPEWSALPVPDRVRTERLRGWCARRPDRGADPVCGSEAGDERQAGTGATRLPAAGG